MSVASQSFISMCKYIYTHVYALAWEGMLEEFGGVEIICLSNADSLKGTLVILL